MILSERERVTQTQVKYLVLVLPTQVNKQTNKQVKKKKLIMNAVNPLNILNTNNSCLHINFPTVGTRSYIFTY